MSSHDKTIPSKGGTPGQKEYGDNIANKYGTNPNSDPSGIRGSHTPEARINWRRTGGELLLGNSNNAWIILGPDRFASPHSGKGGIGSHGCSSIDLVCGRSSYDPDPNNTVDTNFITDAARVYISQNADIDRYLGIDVYDPRAMEGAEPEKGCVNSKDRSCVAAKADAIRLVGREGIKLVTRTEARNSHSEPIDGIQGIDLIAGADPDLLQPMVKGDNLVFAFEELADMMMSLCANLMRTQGVIKKMNYALGTHFHNSPFFGIPTSPSPTLPGAVIACNQQLSISNTDTKTVHKNLQNLFVNTYLHEHGEFAIRSKWNKVN